LKPSHNLFLLKIASIIGTFSVCLFVSWIFCGFVTRWVVPEDSSQKISGTGVLKEKNPSKM
jgi:predicted permease